MSLNSFRSKSTHDFLKRFFATYLVVGLLVFNFGFRPHVVLADDGSTTPSDQNPPADQSESSSTVSTGDATAAADLQNQVNNNVITTNGSDASSTQSGGDASTTPGDTASTTPGGDGGTASTTPGDNGTTTPADNGTSSTTIQGDNTASTTNNVDVSASTGSNSASGNSGNASIQTGTGIASANVINVVNTNIIDSTGLFLFLSNLGGLLGNIDIRQLGIFGQGSGTDTNATPGQGSSASRRLPSRST